jgi:lipopolysaccharide transport system permease protein
MRLIKELWAYRGFITSSVKREFQSKYANSLFGCAWNVLNPLATILVYTVIFAQVMRARLPGVDNTFAYSIFLCAGILTWGLFAEITGRSQTMFIENANLLKKLRFPRICLPAVVVANALLNFTIIFSLFTVFLLISGNCPGSAYLALFPLLLLLLVFSTGLGMVLGVLNVFFRDVGQAFSIIVTFWFWLTPIVYSPTILPSWVQKLMAFNPLAAFIGAVQGVLVRDAWPVWSSLTYMAGFAFLLCFFGLRLFRRHSAEMVDEL